MAQETELKANSRDAIHYKIMEIIKDYPPGQALDFPSGFGRLSFWLQQKGYNIVSCDVTPESYKDSPINHRKADLNKEFPFENNTFDYAFCIEGPEHSENLYHTFREFFRVLKSEGLFIISMPNQSNMEARLKYLLNGVYEPVISKDDFRKSTIGPGRFHINRPSYALLRMALEAAGFSIIELTYDKHKSRQVFFYPLYLLIKLINIFAGDKHNKKYWTTEANSRNVLMGGNTLIIISKKG